MRQFHMWIDKNSLESSGWIPVKSKRNKFIEYAGFIEYESEAIHILMRRKYNCLEVGTKWPLIIRWNSFRDD